MLFLFLLVVSVLAIEPLNNDATVPAVPGYAIKVPDIAPYNFFSPARTASILNYQYLSRICLPIDARHKKARVVFSDESQEKVIGFDMYIKGMPQSLQPLIPGEDCSVTAKYWHFFLDLPSTPEGWNTTALEYKYGKKTFTSRERFMNNVRSDFYLKFRNPSGADADQTKQLVERINSQDRLSLSGIKTVQGLSVVSGNEENMLFSGAFESKHISTVYLDLEYESINVEVNKKGRKDKDEILLNFLLLGPMVFLLFLFSLIPSCNIFANLLALTSAFALTQLLISVAFDAHKYKN